MMRGGDESRGASAGASGGASMAPVSTASLEAKVDEQTLVLKELLEVMKQIAAK
jgi:hypothetical protein